MRMRMRMPVHLKLGSPGGSFLELWIHYKCTVVDHFTHHHIGSRTRMRLLLGLRMRLLAAIHRCEWLATIGANANAIASEQSKSHSHTPIVVPHWSQTTFDESTASKVTKRAVERVINTDFVQSPLVAITNRAIERAVHSVFMELLIGKSLIRFESSAHPTLLPQLPGRMLTKWASSSHSATPLAARMLGCASRLPLCNSSS